MCLSALILARAGRIAWACGDPFGGGHRLLRLNPWPLVCSVELVPEPLLDFKQASRTCILACLELASDEEKARLFRDL